jgi:hypothetical protein
LKIPVREKRIGVGLRVFQQPAKASTDAKDPIGRKSGQVVSVTPDDTGRDPVIGELVTSGAHEIVILRSDPAIGEVCVHFPRAGFVVTSQ